jgi:hypothetical protein
MSLHARVTPLRRENWAADPPLPRARLRRALPRTRGSGRLPRMLMRGRGWFKRLWLRSFADVVSSLAGLTP